MKEKIRTQQGFLPIPLILGIIFILLLGGVGLGIVKTQEKISKAVNEIQKLEKEQKYDESIKKLEALENSFLVRYFGFRKDEIQNEIEKNKELLEIYQAELKEQNEEEKELEPEKEEEMSQNQVVDCHDNLDCLIETAKNCIPAKLRDVISVEVAGYVATISFFGEIRVKEGEKCPFYVRAEKLINLKKEGLSQEEIAKEKEKLKPFIEGTEELCLFRNEDLIKWLEIAKEGQLPSFEGAECKYHGVEMLKNL